MSPTARASSTKFLTEESTITKVPKPINNIVKTVDLSLTSTQSETLVRSISFDMHHEVIGGTLLCTIKVTQT